MTMKLTKVTKATPEVEEIGMKDLRSGEVGFIIHMKRYVLRIGNYEDARFLILGDHGNCNWYDDHGATGNLVRRLHKGEEVVITFSRGA